MMQATALRFARIAAAALVLLAGTGCTGTEPAGPPQPVVRRDTTIANLAYGTHPSQILDLGMPASRTSATPLVVVVHGGGWVGGDKGELTFMVPGFMSRGLVVANVNYRLATAGTDNIGMQLDDLALAISTVQARAARDGFNAQSVYLVGHSAGAHLALMYAYTRNAARRIRAVGALAAPSDLFALAYYNPFPGDWQIGLGALLNMPLFPITAASEARYRSVSPWSVAASGAPPTILFHGAADPRVPPEQSAALAIRLGELAVERKHVVYGPFVFHDWWSDAARRNDTLDQLRDWFNAHP